MGFVAGFLRVLIFAYGHIFHLFGDDTLLSIVHLRKGATLLGFARQADMLETQIGQRRILTTGATILGTEFRKNFAVAPTLQPRRANIGQAFFQIDIGLGVGIRTAGIVDIHRRVGRVHPLSVYQIHRIDKVDFAHGHLYRKLFALDVYFFRTRKGFARKEIFFHDMFYVIYPKNEVSGLLASATSCALAMRASKAMRPACTASLKASAICTGLPATATAVLTNTASAPISMASAA